jgi:hypothetical protein
MFKNSNNKEATTAINFDSDWRYIRLSNSTFYDDEFVPSEYNDEDWTSIQLPHYDDKKLHRFTSTCVSYWYRKRFELREKFDKDQHIYLHFESMSEENKQDKNESDVKIPAVTIWLNERKIFRNTLPEPINITNYLNTDSQNVLVIHSKQGFRLRLHARLLVPCRLSGQIDLNGLHADIPKKGREKTVEYEATFNDSDGLIALFINAVQKHAKRNGIDDGDKDFDDEKQKSKHFKIHETLEVKAALNTPIPRLAILILIVGTRGDVQPFIALSKALLACGHRVRLATHETFRKFVRENGIEFYPLAGDPADLMSFMVKNAGIVPSVSSIIAGDIGKNRRVIAEILASTWKACKEDDDETDLPFLAEAIIANPPSYGHIHCAQKLQIPLHIVFTMPWSPTVQFPHPFVKVDYSRAPSDKMNMLSYDLVEVLVSRL